MSATTSTPSSQLKRAQPSLGESSRYPADVSAALLGTDPLTAARRLLGATLACRGVDATIVEVEAYGGGPEGLWPDPAAHSFCGRTPRNAVMFGPPGHLYTYRSYGMHVCANVVCGQDGSAAAVLLRAAVITRGESLVRARRGDLVAGPAWARGPGNLCAALGITLQDNGIDLFDPGSSVGLRLGEALPAQSGPRVGVSRAADRAWRFWAPATPQVSAYRRSSRAPAPGASD